MNPVRPENAVIHKCFPRAEALLLVFAWLFALMLPFALDR
jgi:hypothetical protein